LDRPATGKMDQLRQIPMALEPIYITSLPNTTIKLFEGDVLLIQAEKTFSTTGIIELKWLPLPKVRFELSPVDDIPDLSEAQLKIPELSLSCDVLVHSGLSKLVV
jgi:hypothetical protein